VLGNFSKTDQDWLAPMLDAIAAAAPLLAHDENRFATDVAQRRAAPRADNSNRSKLDKSETGKLPATPAVENPGQDHNTPFADAFKKLLGRKNNQD
jgi:PTH1 family peptidyl-tRNA hydrolase